MDQHLCLLILTQAMAALEEAEGVANTAHVLWPWVERTGSGGPDLGGTLRESGCSWCAPSHPSSARFFGPIKQVSRPLMAEMGKC